MKKIEELNLLVKNLEESFDKKIMKKNDKELDIDKIISIIKEINTQLIEIKNLVSGIKWYEFVKLYSVLKKIVEIVKSW